MKLRWMWGWVLLFLGWASALELGTVPPHMVLQGDSGGKVDGKSWDSASLKGKVHILFYVDPDERGKNEALTHALKSERFDRSKFTSTAVINLAATWLPNMVLERLLQKKQQEFPDTLYVKDKKKVLVKRWHLKDDAYNVLVFDRSGKLIYRKTGKLSDKEIDELIGLIKRHL